MATKDDVWLAFESEVRNRQLYQAFAARAEDEGLGQIARLFRAAAESELVLAMTEVEELGLIGPTRENLHYAVAAEENEFQDAYAKFLLEARKEGNERAAAMFGNAMRVERGHHKLFSDALKVLLAKETFAAEPIYVCQACGNTVIGARPGACEICGSLSERFSEVE